MRIGRAVIGALTTLAAVASYAQVPYLETAQPIVDEDGRVQVIVDFRKAARDAYPRPAIPRPQRRDDPDAKAVPFFHHPQTLALVADVERAHGFTGQGITSWVGSSVTAFLDAAQIERLRHDERIQQISQNARVTFSWADSTSGGETTSWGHQAVQGKVRTVSNNRKIYVVDSGVAYHTDLAGVIDRRNVACGHGDCHLTASSTYPVVGCYPHSTHVAGIITATANNNTGTQGVYAGANVVSLSILSRSGGDMCGDPDSIRNNQPVSDARVGYAIDYMYWDTLYNNTWEWVNIASLSLNSGGLSIDVVANNYSNPIPQANWAKVRALATPDMVWVGCGLQPECPQYEDQFKYYPAIFVAQSSGNDDADACSATITPNRHYLPYAPSQNAPYVSAVTTDGIMVVGALKRFGENSVAVASGTFSDTDPPNLVPIPFGSNHGDCVDIWAPGDGIYSTWGALYANTLPSITYSGIASISGTSMAAPHVAAAAAYYADAHWLSTPREIEEKIRATVYAFSGADLAVRLQ